MSCLRALAPKDYRARGSARRKAMTLSSAEFMRRFLLHVLPAGLHPAGRGRCALGVGASAAR